MGNCMSNAGSFEPPGAAKVNAYVAYIDRETDPSMRALRAAELRASRAEAAAGQVNLKVPPKPKGPKCSICKSHVDITVNPWQLTRGDLLSLELSDDSDAESHNEGGGEIADARAVAARIERRRAKLKKRGFELTHCKHVFCGACLAESIYRNLNVPFDPSKYGTKLQPPPPAGTKRVEFPMGCPTCPVKPGEKLVEIGDLTARLILGDCNMDEWNQARFISTLDIIYCPHKGCNEPFDANDVAPAPSDASYADGLVQCPRCHKSLCRNCKVVWHDDLSCEQFQALPLHERAPEDLAFMDLAKKEKWRRCPKCKAMVELKFGCNHITCTCKHHFCYTCGADFEHKDGKYFCTGGKGCQVWDERLLLERL